MKRALPVWLAAVVPATLAGHGLAYALAGRSTADGHHAWLAPALECSLAFLITACLTLAGGTLLRSGLLRHTADERSMSALWLRLGISQTLLFCAMERAEGAHAALLGIAVQLLVAWVAAYLLCAFARVLVRCARSADRASRYLQRLFPAPPPFVNRLQTAPVFALPVRAGTARFQRPPPQR